MRPEGPKIELKAAERGGWINWEGAKESVSESAVSSTRVFVTVPRPLQIFHCLQHTG